jgi:GST-like protein
MIDVHYWTTPNGHKITIFLEEAGLQYRVIPVNIGKGEQFTPEFLAISPNNRIPAIVDHEPPDGGKPLAIFESGAILLYLANKTGKFIATEMRAHGHDSVAVLADGQPRPDGRSEQSLQ